MRNFIMVFICLVVGVSSLAGSPDSWLSRIRANMGTNEVLVYACKEVGAYAVSSRAQLSASPVWDGLSDPPLPLGKAVELARRVLRKESPEYLSFDFSQGSIGPIYQPGVSKGVWSYSLFFQGHSQVKQYRSFIVPVLMDGSVLELHLVENLSSHRGGIPAVGIPVSPDPHEVTLADDSVRKRVEQRMNNIIIPQVDFRQANLYDVIDFIDKSIVRHGVGLETNNDTRVHVTIDESVFRDTPPPHGLIALPPEIAFEAKNISLRKLLDIVTGVSDLGYRIQGNVVTVCEKGNSTKVDATRP